jgi:hypothetical protein
MHQRAPPRLTRAGAGRGARLALAFCRLVQVLADGLLRFRVQSTPDQSTHFQPIPAGTALPVRRFCGWARRRCAGGGQCPRGLCESYYQRNAT